MGPFRTFLVSLCSMHSFRVSERYFLGCPSPGSNRVANSGEVQKTAQGKRKGCARTWKTNAPRVRFPLKHVRIRVYMTHMRDVWHVGCTDGLHSGTDWRCGLLSALCLMGERASMPRGAALDVRTICNDLTLQPSPCSGQNFSTVRATVRGRPFLVKKPSAGHCVVTPITKICSESIPPISQMSAETCHT